MDAVAARQEDLAICRYPFEDQPDRRRLLARRTMVAYTSTDSTKTTVYVQPFPPTGAKYELLARGADGPHEVTWSADDKELFYNPRPGRIRGCHRHQAADICVQLSHGRAEIVHARPSQRATRVRRHSGRQVHRCGGGGTAPSATGLAQTVAAQMKINVVLNWFEELKQRVPR